MRSHKNLCCLVVVSLGSGALSTAVSAKTPEERGLEIARATDAANEGFKTDVSDVEMKLINAHGDTVDRKMSIHTLEGTDDGDRSVVVFSWPADVDGTKLLTWTHQKGNDDQWLYLPALKRIKRISSRNKSGSFVGSEFAYEDMSSQEVDKYNYKFIEEATYEGRKVWVTERYPTDKRSGYSRQMMWVDQEYMNPLKIEYYDRKNELLKVGVFSGYKKFGKFWRFSSIEMSNTQTRKRSTLIWKTRKLGEELDEEDFESDALEG